jgi:pimeloyl-ACP methyl ester carboxylesterase
VITPAAYGRDASGYDSAVTPKIAELIIVGVVVLLVLGASAYLFGSYYVMSRHVSPRPAVRHAAAMVREFLYVIITQPLVPIYYVAGRKMGPGDGVPVVFIHGYSQNRSNFWWLARQFEKASLGPLFGFNYPWSASIDDSSQRLSKFVESVCIETGEARVILVAHSLGGLIALEYAHSPTGTERVAECITVGTPHGGVKWRGPIPGRVGRELREEAPFVRERQSRQVPAPTLSVYSTHDNIVHPPSTSELASRGGQDLAVDGHGHLSLLYSRDVANALISFIRHCDE